MGKLDNAPVASNVGARQPAPSTAMVTYQAVTASFRADGGAEARALKMMFPTRAEQDRYLAVVFGLLASESDILQSCTPLSIIDSIKTAATMGLEPGTTDGSLIKRGSKCTFMPEYGGYLKRIRNSGKVLDVDTQIVMENDHFNYRLGTDPNIDHVPALTDRGNFSHVYAWALMPSGKYLIDVLDVAEVDQIRDTYGPRNNAGQLTGPWLTSYGEMARKTSIRRLAKRLPQEATGALLMADAQADAIQHTVVAVKDGMADLRAIAMRAVQTPETGQGQADQPKLEATTTSAPASPQGPSTEA